MMFSYFLYGAAFTEEGGTTDSVEPVFVAAGLAIAPFVFVIVAFVSQNPRAPRDVVRAMGLLLVVGLSVGLLDPLLGAAAGFAAGGAATLNRPDVERLISWRVGAVVFTTLYCLVLFVVVTPAGVFTGAVVPLMMIGFADEYAVWSAANRGR